ncbi:c-type cytochrome [Cohnella soli]|uniref:C-type cytochrome n=1 Tax=Cohnella soli TaxID=425005 RepID=A0ABW0I452_9BACL
MYKRVMAGMIILACVFGLYLIVYSLPAKQTPEQPSATFKVPDTPVDADAAMQQYKSNCIACHGDSLQGGMGPNLTKVGGTMTKEQIFKQIAKGGGGMPSFEQKLTKEQIVDVTNWLSAMK